VPLGWSLGTTAADHQVCRYTTDLARSGAIDRNEEHPSTYTAVDRSLQQQNFLVIRGDQHCPRSTAMRIDIRDVAGATAISTASWHLFENIGIAEGLEQFACDIASIAVTDQNKPGRLDFVPGEGGGTLGRMFPNRRLRLALFEAAAKEPLINWVAKAHVTERQRSEYGVAAVLADGQNLKGRLMIAAEGRQSPTRDAAGISIAKWDYKHRAIIAGLTHEKPHGNVAWEIFYPAGPFALLPLNDDADGTHRSSLVWTVSEEDAAGVTKLGDLMRKQTYLETKEVSVGDAGQHVNLQVRRKPTSAAPKAG
jgi:2-polyprenyl-6-methoxyphenol hydroxylase-like FAD-dependent oxidoreductase